MQPTILLESLQSVRRRVRVLAVAHGAGLVLTAAVGLLVAAVAADWLLNLPAVPRAALVLAAAAAVAWATWRWLVGPALARLSLNDVAGRVEQAYPQFQDRLRGSVDLLEDRDVPGSPVMKQRMLSEAARLAQSLDLTRVVVARPVWISSTGAAAAVAALAILLAVVGQSFTKLALTRLFLPFGTTVWPRTVEIASVGTLPDRVTVGQRVDVNVRLTSGDRPSRRTTIFYQYGDDAGHFGPVQQEYMTRGDDGVYHAALDAKVPDTSVAAAAALAAGTMKIWTDAGDGHLGLPLVHVVQRLTIDRVEADVTPPPYARQPAARLSLSQPATVVAGSALTLTATFNKPLAEHDPVTTEVSGGGPAVAAAGLRWMATSPTTATATLTAAESVRFHLHATDADGVRNTGAEEFELVVRPDQSPTVMIESPRRNEDRTPQAVVPIEAVAEDDFGIAGVTLVVQRLGDKKRWDVPLVRDGAAVAPTVWNRVDATATAGGGDLLRFRGRYDWDLAALPDANLKPGDVLEYYLSARDNYALNGATHPPATSGHLRVNIISQEELTNQLTAELQTSAEQVHGLRRDQAETQRQTNELNKATAGKPQMDAADQAAADRLAAQQGTLAGRAKSVAGKMADVGRRLAENKSPNAELKSTAKDVGDLLDAAAEGPMKHAAAGLADAKQAPAPGPRQQDLKDAATAQAESGDKLQRAMDRMGNIGTLSTTITDLRDLLAAQQKLSGETAEAGKATLGQTPDQLSPADKAKLDALAKEQAALADRTNKAVAAMQQDAGKLAKTDPASSAAMKQAAGTAQNQNVAANQQKAAQKTGENKQSDAQSAQKQAELGLQMMLADLAEAEKHKLDELNRKLSELQEQVATLVRRQAGHNLDVLADLGPTFPGGPDAATRTALVQDAQRDPVAPPPPTDAAAVSAGQEQTERNARDIAKAAGDLPDGSAPAEHLTDAADQMERAIVHLRANQLPAAYDPPQVAALDALRTAKRLVDEQKKKADEHQDDEKKEALRQAFVAVRGEQATVNGKVSAINGSTRRADLIALGQLVGDQGKVADHAEGLDARLTELGSIVYTWANHDVVRHMRSAKDALGQQDSGPVVQAEQRQVLDELDAIIRDLATSPVRSKFAQNAQDPKGGGGGGGKSSPAMPTEAELRLLKDLQKAENAATVDLAKTATHKAETLALGSRQGDLRDLLDKLIQKASKGVNKLPPEPRASDPLPEERAAEAAAKTGGDVGEKIDEQELQDDLIGNGAKPKPKTKPTTAPGAKPKPPTADDDGGDHELALVGGRMGRSRQRLAVGDDPGPVTQEIQKRILDNLDDLIEQARKKEARQQNTPPKKGEDGEPMGQPKPDAGLAGKQQGKPGRSHQEAGASPAETANGGGNGPAKPTDAVAGVTQEDRMWGQVSPRQRKDIMESNGDRVLDKYKPLVDDYWRNMAARAKATGQ